MIIPSSMELLQPTRHGSLPTASSLISSGLLFHLAIAQPHLMPPPIHSIVLLSSTLFFHFITFTSPHLHRYPINNSLIYLHPGHMQSKLHISARCLMVNPSQAPSRSQKLERRMSELMKMWVQAFKNVQFLPQNDGSRPEPLPRPSKIHFQLHRMFAILTGVDLVHFPVMSTHFAHDACIKHCPSTARISQIHSNYSP